MDRLRRLFQAPILTSCAPKFVKLIPVSRFRVSSLALLKYSFGGYDFRRIEIDVTKIHKGPSLMAHELVPIKREGVCGLAL